MDLDVKWSPEAIEDLESMAEYIAQDSEFYAKSVVTKMLAAEIWGQTPFVEDFGNASKVVSLR